MNALRERLAAALCGVGHCEHTGAESCDPWWYADAAIPAIIAWLHDLAASQWKRVDQHDWEPSRQMAMIRAMYLTDLAIGLEPVDQDIQSLPILPSDVETYPIGGATR